MKSQRAVNGLVRAAKVYCKFCAFPYRPPNPPLDSSLTRPISTRPPGHTRRRARVRAPPTRHGTCRPSLTAMPTAVTKAYPIPSTTDGIHTGLWEPGPANGAAIAKPFSLFNGTQLPVPTDVYNPGLMAAPYPRLHTDVATHDPHTKYDHRAITAWFPT